MSCRVDSLRTTHGVRIAPLLFALTCTGLVASTARAANCVWKAGSTQNFNASTANWSCGVIPDWDDNVYFCNGSCQSTTGTNQSCNITSAITVASINMGTSYSATVAAGANTVDILGDYTQSSNGTFSAPSTRLTVGGAFNKTNGTFTHNGGAVVLESTSSKTFTVNATTTFYDLAINDSLVGYWKLDETSTPARDYSGYGNHLARTNSPVSDTNVPSTMDFADPRSIALDGATSDALVLTMPASAQISLPLTISAWYRATTTDSAGGEIVSGADSYNIHLSTTGLSCVKYKGSAVWIGVTASPSGYKDGNWHHVACVMTTSGMTLYFDGSSVGSNADTGAIVYPTPFSPFNLTIGRHGTSGTDRDFTGNIDEVRIYSRALSGSEITTLAGGGLFNGGTGVQTLSGNPVVANDLIIGSGTLSAGSSTISVAADWLNYGGTFTAGTSTVVFNGGQSGRYILINDQAFNNLTISGAGDWTIDEPGVNVTLNGTLAQSAGTLTSTSGLLKIKGAYNKSGGTFTHNGGRVMLASTTNQTFSPNNTSFNNLIINDGLLGYWKLDEGSGTNAADSSGYGNNGTVSGAGVTWQSNVPGVRFRDPYSIALNGSTGSVALGTGNLPVNNAAQTISLWAKLNATGGTQNLISLSNLSNSGVQIQIRGTNLGAYMWGGTTMVTTSAPSTGAWHHIAYTYNGSSGQTLYIDGVETTATVANQSGTPTAAYLGTYNPNSEMYNGSLDDVRIYGRALSRTEINALYLGNQPATNIATQSMSGSATVSSDLTIASGGLYMSTNNLTLQGDWWNYGGVSWADYWAGATVTLTGSSQTNYIRSGGQALPSINITGTGKWTLEDDLDVDPNSGITFTSGSIDILTRTLRVGDLNSGSGTLTASSGTVVLNSNANQTVNVSGYNVLRIEDPSEAGLAGYWKMDEGQGTGVRDWTGNGFTGTLMGDAKWTASVPGTSRIEFHDPYALSFGGTTPYIDIGSPVVATNAAFTACSWVNFNTLTGYQDLVSIDGTQLSGFYLEKVDSTNKFTFIMRSSDVAGGGTAYAPLSTTVATTGTWYHVCGVYTGSVARLYVNGAQEGGDVTVSSTWVASGHTILGAAKWNGARTSYLNGILDDVRIYSVGLSAAQVKALGAGRYAGTGAATVTLGANVSTTNTFSIDSGGLNTSSYTFGTATGDATKVAYVSGGTLTVGSSTATFNGGLTVRDEGTLSMQTTGGVTALPNGETLIIDGTLDASTAGVTPTIQSVSGSYTFTVGSSATATPVLNINGLAVKNTGIDGMYINTVAGSSTTFTKFDNLAFSNGSTSVGSTFLRIYSTSLALKSGGNTFTFAAGKPDSAVELAGNGTADGETRAVFGNTTCPASLCTSSNKSDNDANNDGVGDTPVSNGAVVQFVRAIPTDTAGSIEGFPTAAFDWNTFTYYSTYVAFRNYSGSQDRLFVRASSGAAGYYWDLPTAAGHFVGTPRWTQLSGTKYVYVGTTNGYVYKLVDNTSSLALASSPWDTAYCYGGAPCSANDTITTPLGIDGTNVYWVGTDSSSNRKFFILTHGKSLTSASLSIPAAVTAAPAQATISSIDYLFAGMQGFLYKIKVSDQSSTSWTQPATTSTINGRVTTLGGLAYLADNMGRMYAVNATSLATDWSYQDTTTHGSCTDGSSCTIKNLYVDYTMGRVMYGDKDGHIYVISKNGAGATVMSGYPMQPAPNEVISTAPLSQAGIMLVGTDSGSLFVINVRTASGGTPALLYTYKLGSAISSISYNSNTNSGAGAYMVGTADGKLVLIDKVSDGDAFM